MKWQQRGWGDVEEAEIGPGLFIRVSKSATPLTVSKGRGSIVTWKSVWRAFVFERRLPKDYEKPEMAKRAARLHAKKILKQALEAI